ncbi:MAG: GatB/YqeY domain-containing protein [Clostridia bacterium]|nr:GatB/YqeY domain-containing protein [Clostridia bacterium]MDD4386318.1 GatB/YqeY domain-containing protein [Clostridia bacterium]
MKKMLMNELKEAMRNKEELRKNTITLLRAAILQIEKDDKKVLTDAEMKVVASKEVKKRKEAIIEFEKADRLDLVESLNKEIEVLAKYLPEQLNEEQVREMVKESIKLTGAVSSKDMGKVMQDLRVKTSGKADGKLVSELVKKLLM